MSASVGTLGDDTKLEENIGFKIRVLTHSESADRRFEENIGFESGILTQWAGDDQTLPDDRKVCENIGFGFGILRQS